MTYKLEQLDNLLDKQTKKENYRALELGEKLRCQACNSIYWRVFYDRVQCMGCRSFTRIETELIGSTRYRDLRDVTWIRWQVSKYKDGRVRDPLFRRSEFIIYRNLLRNRVGGTEFIIHPQVKGSWFYGKLEEKFQQMTPSQIMKYLQNTLTA